MIQTENTLFFIPIKKYILRIWIEIKLWIKSNLVHFVTPLLPTLDICL